MRANPSAPCTPHGASYILTALMVLLQSDYIMERDWICLLPHCIAFTVLAFQYVLRLPAIILYALVDREAMGSLVLNT